jgi:membrane protease YdiL (CAAX protease family)
LTIKSALGLMLVFFALYLGSLALIIPASIALGIAIDEHIADLIQLAIAWPLTIWVGLRLFGDTIDTRPTKPLDVRLLPALVAGSAGALIVLLALIGVIANAYTALFGAHAEHVPGGAVADPLVTLVAAVVIAPIAEELFHRGLVLHGLMGRYSVRKAIWISAVIFAVGHLNLGQAMLALPLGLAYGWLTVTTRSIWPAIVSHVSVNASFNFMLEPLLRSEYGGEFTAAILHIPVVLVAPAAVAVIISAWHILRRVRPRNPPG